MKIMLISQDKKSIYDFSQCKVYIPVDSILSIFIKPYSSKESYLLATYEDPTTTEKIFNEIINVLDKSKYLLKTKAVLKPEDLLYAKRTFEKINNEKIIVSDSMFEIKPIGNDYVITYQLPGNEDVKDI